MNTLVLTTYLLLLKKGVKKNQITDTDDYGSGLTANEHIPSDNTGNNLPSTHNYADSENNGEISTEVQNNIW